MTGLILDVDLLDDGIDLLTLERAFCSSMFHLQTWLSRNSVV